jgi:hypothetical protein
LRGSQAGTLPIASWPSCGRVSAFASHTGRPPVRSRREYIFSTFGTLIVPLACPLSAAMVTSAFEFMKPSGLPLPSPNAAASDAFQRMALAACVVMRFCSRGASSSTS